MRNRLTALAAAVGLLAACSPSAPNAITMASSTADLTAAACTFTIAGHTEKLNGDCTTTSSIVIPDGFTLDGKNHTITAMDPAGGHFTGGILINGGSTANVTAVTLTTSNLADICDDGNDRLRGILLDNASGSITHVTVNHVTQDGSGCQEGNSIEVRNFTASAPVVHVTISNNTITNFMKTGIVCNGASDCSVDNNTIGASANQTALAANSVQFGFGSTGTLENNKIAGNTWCTRAGDEATAILLYSAMNVTIKSNNITGNSDIGIDLTGDTGSGDFITHGSTVRDNQLTDTGADCNQDGSDVGIEDDDTNSVTNNTVSGFTTPFVGVTGGHNHVKKPKPMH